MTTTFLHRSNDRLLPSDYAGDVLVWDIDKTYLDTRFSSWRGLLRIPLEFAIDKRAIPGSVPLLRALRHGADVHSAIVPLYFISGSPVQLRKTIERKMTLDGVDYDGITFKDQWGLMRARRARDVKAQVGYKLKALLASRNDLPTGVRYLMFGDDVEADAEVFLLFGEVCGGLAISALSKRLEAHGVHPADAAEILALVEDGPPREADPVERVFIHLCAGTDPARFEDPRIVAARSYVQAALVLAHAQRVRPEAIAAVAKDLRRRQTPEHEIERDLEDAVRRLGVPAPLCDLAR